MNTILVILIIVFFLSFFGYFLYKLQDRKWFEGFMNDNLTDKDVFTQVVKFLMS
jgi:hypothetical protein